MERHATCVEAVGRKPQWVTYCCTWLLTRASAAYDDRSRGTLADVEQGKSNPDLFDATVGIGRRGGMVADRPGRRPRAAHALIDGACGDCVIAEHVYLALITTQNGVSNP
jgi:hypothetical protein